MSHRLLHTLVFASTSLLACGGQIDSVALESSEPDATPPDPPTPPPVPDIQPIDAGPDVRTCEGGWPTTKGAVCTFDNGILCCKNDVFPDAGTICCEKQ